jgi:hypothetical protein
MVISVTIAMRSVLDVLFLITSTSGFKNKLEIKEPLGFQILENCIYKLELII